MVGAAASSQIDKRAAVTLSEAELLFPEHVARVSTLRYILEPLSITYRGFQSVPKPQPTAQPAHSYLKQSVRTSKAQTLPPYHPGLANHLKSRPPPSPPYMPQRAPCPCMLQHQSRLTRFHPTSRRISPRPRTSRRPPKNLSYAAKIARSLRRQVSEYAQTSTIRTPQR